MAVILATTLSSCFTGIESTPKITAKDVKREGIPVKSESSYLSDISHEPFSKWAKGKRFYVSDNKFTSILQPMPGVDSLNLVGTEVYFDSFKEVRDITGNDIVELTFMSADGHSLVYRSDRSLDLIERSGEMRVPFLVEMDVVDDVRARIMGNQYYVITASWFDKNNRAFTGRKFIPVTVSDVLPGNSFYSTIVCLKDENGAQFRLYMSVGGDLKSLRQFDSLFSIGNPRDSYPLISDETWRIICSGKVAAGMTKNECRLALGSPRTVNEQHDYSTIREIWSYETGIFLIFEDGILRSFRQ